MTTVPTGGLQQIRKRSISNTNLGEGLIIAQRDPQHLDADIPVAESSFIYIGEATPGDWVITNSGEVTE